MSRPRIRATDPVPNPKPYQVKAGRKKGMDAKKRGKGPLNRTARQLREWAAVSGELPHMFLLRVSRGEIIEGYKPTFHDRVDASKFCAPYFAPKLASVAVTGEGGGPVRTQTVFIDPAVLQEFPEDELDVLERAFVRLQRGSAGGTNSTQDDALAEEYQSTLDD